MSTTPPAYTGLSADEVRQRVARGETNAFKARVGRSYFDIVRDNVFNLFNVILFTLLVVVLLFRDYATVFFAGFSVVTNSLLGMFQEFAAKRKLESLAALQVKTVRAWRDGTLVSLPIEQIVKDDVIAIAPGDRLVVDGRVLTSDALEMDESQLTGESDPVLKERDDSVYSGSFCIAGTGIMVATQVGRESTINQLSKLAKAYKHVLTPTQQKITTIVQVSVGIMAIAGPMVFIAGYLTGLPTLEMFRNAVVFVTSLVPQGLVLTAILSLTLGAISISRFQTLIQRVNAVESMANVTVLCFDKTGTLTRNQLAVTEIIPLGGAQPDAVRRLLSRYIASLSHQNSTATAIAAHVGGISNGSVPAKVREVPFTSARKWGAIVFPDETLMLGAPERVLHPDLDNQGRDEISERAYALSSAGLRVLAFARSDEQPADGVLASSREPLALIVLSDQVRDDIVETLASFREQQVALKVISGDNLHTVKAIAAQAGMPTEHAYTGDQLGGMSESEFEAAALEASLFARVEPETKRRLIAALKRRGHYVAMVGDGVNDVPALKEANLAVVMNDGAQISKDIGDIVLLNNAMSTLPLAFKEGRAITQTIFGTSKLFLVKNLYSILFFVFAGFMAMPFPINPIQISWLTFGVINVPATLIAFRLLIPTYMAQFRRDVLDYVITAGVTGAASASALYGIVYLTSRGDTDLARSAITIFLTLYGMVAVWNTHGVEVTRISTVFQHWRVFLLTLALGVVTVVVPYFLPAFLPGVAASFRFDPPSPFVWVLILAVTLIATLVLEAMMRTRGLVRRIWALAERS